MGNEFHYFANKEHILKISCSAKKHFHVTNETKRHKSVPFNKFGPKYKTKWRSVCSTLCHLYDVWLPVWCPGLCVLRGMMSAYLYDVLLPVWCLPTCMMSTQQCVACLVYDVYFLYDWSTIWFLLNCMMSAQLDYLCLPVWFLAIYMMSALLYISLPVQYNAILPAWCLPNHMFSAQLYDACLRVWYLPTFTTQLYDLLNCMMSVQLFDV
jgi:hypothetical protein